MSKQKNNLLIAASGTGGHIFPALAIAKDLSKDWKIYWLGIEKRSDAKFVPKKYNITNLKIETPNKNNNIFLFFQYIKILFSFIHVIRIIRKRNINLVFTTGGYISAPTILAARILNIPVIIHESNCVPGTVTKYFGNLCEYVLTGFKETNLYLKNCKTIFTGTPLRDQFYIKNKLPEWVPKAKGPLIIVIGGSQGANGLNEMLLDSLDFLFKYDIRVVHIVGNTKRINLKNKNYKQINFTNQIAPLMQNCDLVISRSGSGTINELIETQKPSILVPYPNSKNDHQEKNAMLLASIGGAIIINENPKSRYFLEKTLQRLFELERKKKKYKILNMMRKNMKSRIKTNPRIEIKKCINQFLKDF